MESRLDYRDLWDLNEESLRFGVVRLYYTCVKRLLADVGSHRVRYNEGHRYLLERSR